MENLKISDLKRLTWQAENCLSCKWFKIADTLNSDILSNGRCMQQELKKFELVISGRDWCNKFEEIPQSLIDHLQEEATKKEEEDEI